MSIDARYCAFNEARADEKWNRWLVDDGLMAMAREASARHRLYNEKSGLEGEYRKATTIREKYRIKNGRYPSDEELYRLDTGNPADWNEVNDVQLPSEIKELDERIAELSRRISDLRDISADFGETSFLESLGKENGKIDRVEFLYELVSQDLAFGSESVWLDEPKREGDCWHVMLALFAPRAVSIQGQPIHECDISLLNEKDVISCFENIDVNKFWPFLKSLDSSQQSELDIGDDDSLNYYIETLVDFARQIRPIAVDLKQNNSRLIVEHCGDREDDPVLNGRAERHMDYLRKKHPGLNEKIS